MPEVGTGWKPFAEMPEECKNGKYVLLGRFVKGNGVMRNGFQAVDWYRTDEAKHGFIGFGCFNMNYWPPTHYKEVDTPPKEEWADGQG